MVGRQIAKITDVQNFALNFVLSHRFIPVNGNLFGPDRKGRRTASHQIRGGLTSENCAFRRGDLDRLARINLN